jgi:hypothetical protein
VRDTAADRVPNGTFMSGQTAFCKGTGRPVTSDPSAGERPTQSDVRLQVHAKPGKTSYAVLTVWRHDVSRISGAAVSWDAVVGRAI